MLKDINLKKTCIKYFSILFIILLFACDGRIKVKIYTYENNSVNGVFHKDTLLDGTPVPNTNLKIYISAKDSNLSLPLINDFKLNTDSLGEFKGTFATPPFHKKRYFHGFIFAEKSGYKRSIIKFKHSSLDSVYCIINMQKLK